jgi:hypothetical protein
MRAHKFIRVTGVAALLLAGSALNACSSDDDDAADTPFGQALTEKFLSFVAVSSSDTASAAGTRYVDLLFDVDVTPGIVYATEPSL